jgi:hypothetical protein
MSNHIGPTIYLFKSLQEVDILLFEAGKTIFSFIVMERIPVLGLYNLISRAHQK